MSELNTITVAQLKDLLDGYPDDMPVMMSAESKDYWGTELANDVGNYDIDTKEVKYSDYHQQYVIPDQGEIDPEDETITVLILE